MFIEYPHNKDRDTLKYKIDENVAKLNHLQFQGNFEITELIKSWIKFEMQYSILLKQGVIERRIKGILKIKEDKILISLELPEIIKNFITEQKLQSLISKQLDNITG